MTADKKLSNRSESHPFFTRASSRVLICVKIPVKGAVGLLSAVHEGQTTKSRRRLPKTPTATEGAGPPIDSSRVELPLVGRVILEAVIQVYFQRSLQHLTMRDEKIFELMLRSKLESDVDSYR